MPDTKPVQPFVREFKEGATGPDCKAVKRALHAAGKDTGMNLSTGLFGGKAESSLKMFQVGVHLVGDGVYGPATHRALAPYFDAFGSSLLSREAILIAKTSLRDKYVEALLWGVTNRTRFTYAEVRPIPVTMQPFAATGGIVTDCSGWVTLAAKWAGCPDPNGLNFNGEGYTGTLLAHCKHILASEARPGTLIVYGPAPSGWHVAAIKDHLPGGDFELVSNGHEGCPELIAHSVMAASQARNGHPGVTFCDFLP